MAGNALLSVNADIVNLYTYHNIDLQYMINIIRKVSAK